MMKEKRNRSTETTKKEKRSRSTETTKRKRRRSEQSCSHLPENLVISIFERLPAKSILRFRSVSKTYRSLIHKSSFLSAHLKRSHDTFDPIYTIKHSNNILYHLVQGRFSDSLRLRVYDVSNESLCAVYRTNSAACSNIYHVIDCCNGVLCFLDFGHRSFCLWNPILNKFKFTQRQNSQMPLDFTFRHLGFGYDPRSNQFKVLCVYRDNFVRDPPILARLYKTSGIGNSNEWTISDISPPPIGIGPRDQISYKSVYVKGASHWLKITNRKYVSILSFHFADEVFDEMPLPPPLQDMHYTPSISELQLTECDGMLFIYNVWLDLKNPALWIMKVYGDPHSWVPLVKMMPPLSRRLGKFSSQELKVLGFKNQGEDVLISRHKFLYNGTDSSKSVTVSHLCLLNLKTLELRELKRISPFFFFVLWSFQA